MSKALSISAETQTRQRAIEYVATNFGSLSDLPRETIQVVWVTVLRCVEAGVAAKPDASASVILKSPLLGTNLARDLDSATRRIRFLNNMIPIIRSSKTHDERLADCQLLADVLKWNIVDAGNMHAMARLIVRQFRRADPEYRNPVPPEILVPSLVGAAWP